MFQDVHDLLLAPVPIGTPRQRTFFDISGNSHSEKVFTHWYCYFLQKEEDHGLGSLFIDTLKTLAEFNQSIDDFEVEREIITEKGNKIDLVVAGKGKDEGKYILIENKINHWLKNDLEDYWENFKSWENNKVGVLLTLTPHVIPQSVKGKFKNVTHLRWLSLIKQSASSLNLHVEQRYHFNQFCTAILNLSKDYTMNDQVEFYFNNAEKVNQILETHRQAHQFVLSQLDLAANQMEFTLGEKQIYIATITFPVLKKYTIP